MFAERAQPFHIQLFNLTLIQLANWRWSWRSTLLTAIVAPLMTTAALGVFAVGTESTAYVLTGNLVMSLLFGTFHNVAGHFAYMRLVGRLDYFATLPIYRVGLILASVFAFMVLSLPAVVLTLFTGALIIGAHLTLSPWLLLVLPLIATSLCGLGTLLGIIVKSPQEVSNLSSLITFVLVGFGPVVIPPSRLPGFVEYVSYISPATYAASALRQTVFDMSDRIPLAIDLLVLFLILASTLWLVSRKMSWRMSAL